jgi:anti-sigma factor RsiW
LKEREVVISCLEMFRVISEYVDGTVDPELRARMENHFRGCKHCTAVLAGTRNVVQLIGDGRTFDVPPTFSTRLYEKLREHIGGLKHPKK